VAIGEDAVCVFNSTPVEKYESFRLCLEKWNGDDQPDFAPAIYNLILSLARSLGFRSNSSHNGTQPKFLMDLLPEVVRVDKNSVEAGIGLRKAFHLEDEDTRAAQSAIEERGCFYGPETNTFFVREFRMAFAAAEAARFLHHACQGFPAKRMANSAIEEALAHFGSRLLCPGTGTEICTSSASGEALYQAYLNGKISKAALRRIFLAPGRYRAEAEKTLAGMSQQQGSY
jgi:hypothetical protein